jgi:rhodanese-related sulfurtransferase
MEIAPSKVARWLSEQKTFSFLDVRTLAERDTASLGGLHIPLQELEARLSEIPRGQGLFIVYCHHGVRSLYATQFLRFHGFDALSLRGGIDLWSIEVDPSIPRY